MGQKFSIGDYQTACQQGNLQLLKDIVKEGKVDLNSRLTTPDDGGCSGLHVAVRNCHPEIISYLLSLSRTASEATKSLVNVEIPDDQARTPFLLAVLLRNIDAVKLFTEFRDVDLAAREVMEAIPINGSFGMTDGTELSAFHLAVINDDVKMLSCLISAVPKRKKRATSFVSRNPEQQQPQQEGQEEASSNSPSKSIIANSSKEDIVLDDSRTISHASLSLTITIPSSSNQNADEDPNNKSEKHYDVPPPNSPQHLLTGKQLLITLFDSNGLSAVHMAVKHENLALVKYFVDQCDINPDLEDLFHQTLLMQACKRNSRNHNSSSTAILSYLILEKGVKVNRASPGGWTAIFYAASNGNLVAVEFLAKNGADLFVKAEKTNHTCADIAQKNGHVAVAEKLKELMAAM